MPKFTITLQRTLRIEQLTVVNVEADSKDQACDLAHEIDVPDKQWTDSNKTTEDYTTGKVVNHG